MHKLTHQQILDARLTPEQSMCAPRFPVVVCATNIRSMYNIGSLFRTCDAARVQELILCGFTPHPPRAEIAKTALGAVDTVPWRYEKVACAALRGLRDRGVKIIAVELTDDARPYTELDMSDMPCCLVLGNELTGIADDVLAECDDAVMIPMHGVKHSLNVSVAAGIVIFEAVRAAS
ncbi:MAG: RNA methyltransferase [Candidatus Kapaibacterium sp.]